MTKRSYISGSYPEIEAFMYSDSEISPGELGEKWAEDLKGYDDRCDSAALCGP